MKLRLLKKITPSGCEVFYFQVLRKTLFGERWDECCLEISPPFITYDYYGYGSKERAEEDLESTQNAKKYLSQPHEVVGEYEL